MKCWVTDPCGSFAGPSGWLCCNLHGLDDEGWGPIGSDALERLLERLVTGDVLVRPITAALDLAMLDARAPDT